MNPTPPYRQSRKRRRVSVEVYFVLYLSAITLLLGTTTHRNSNENDSLERAVLKLVGNDFRLDAERAALIYSFVPASTTDTGSYPDQRRDSVNIIRAYGNVTDIRFKIAEINDTSTGQSLPVSRASLVRQGDRTALFTWDPASVAKKNAVYRVTVCATAYPVLPAVLDEPEIRQRVIEILEQRGALSDSVTFTVNVFQGRIPANIQALASTQTTPVAKTGDSQSPFPRLMPQTTPFQPNQFSLQSASLLIRSIPKAEWRNRVMVSGVADLQREATLECTPNARISSITASTVELTGIAPANGRQDIFLKAKRKDGATAALSFTVTASPLDPPDIPGSFFVGQSVRLNFGSSDVPSGQISVEVIENGKTVISKEDGGAVLQYIPSQSGTVRFQRYMGDQPVDGFTKQIRNLPIPSIEQLKTGSSADEVIVPTVSYGSIDGTANKVRLKVLKGNAEDPEELTDKYRYDPTDMSHRQYWRIKKSRAGEFVFSVYAIDRRGSSFKSGEVKFSP